MWAGRSRLTTYMASDCFRVFDRRLVEPKDKISPAAYGNISSSEIFRARKNRKKQEFMLKDASEPLRNASLCHKMEFEIYVSVFYPSEF